MKLVKSFAFFSFMALLSCGTEKTHQYSKIANVLGEEPHFAILPGQGFNSVDGTVKGHCVTLGNFETQSGNSTGSTAEFRLLEITSESTLRESLNVAASASFGGLVGRASARMNYSNSVNKNSQSRYLMVHTRAGNQLEIAKSFTYSQSAQALLKQGKHNEFLKQCGNEFAYGRRTGGEFYALFEFEFSSVEQERAFSAAVSASGSGWRGAASVNSELAKFNMAARTHVKMFKVGGGAGLPEVSNLTDFALKFNKLVASASSPVTLEILTKSYDGVEPIDLTFNPELTVRQMHVMGELARSRDDAKEVLNSLRYIQKNMDAYPTASVAHLEESEKRTNNYLNKINSAAVDCFADLFRGCQLPDAVFPTVKLPPRQQSTCRIVTRRICTIPSDEGCLAYKTVNEEVCN